MIALAILDNAFESKIKSVRQLFQIQVLVVHYSLEFQWKKEKLKTSVFQQTELSVTEIQTFNVKTLHYYIYLYYLQQLDLAAEFMQILCAYNIQQETGEAVKNIWKYYREMLSAISHTNTSQVLQLKISFSRLWCTKTS